MLVTDFALTILNPVGHGDVKLHRLLTDLQVQALTAMDGGNADIAGANYAPSISLLLVDGADKPRLVDQWPHWLSTDCTLSRPPQTSGAARRAIFRVISAALCGKGCL